MDFKKYTRKETYSINNTLVCIPHLLKNINTIIDLRNHTTVAGTIDEVDG